MKYFIHALKNYANFNGRARRKEYWFFQLFQIIIVFGLSFLAGLLSHLNEGLGIFASVLAVIALIGFVIPGLAVTVRRMHDVGKEWWYMLIPIYSLILVFTEGQAGPNEYGEDPKMLDF